MTALAILKKDEIIDRMSNGEYVQDIAKSMSVTVGAISKQLVDDPDYQDAIETALKARMIKREGELELAQDMPSISRSRELLAHARWLAERECPKRWGKETAVAVQVNPSFTVVLSTHASHEGGPQTVIEGKGVDE